jgi:hypothetical protein
MYDLKLKVFMNNIILHTNTAHGTNSSTLKANSAPNPVVEKIKRLKAAWRSSVEFDSPVESLKSGESTKTHRHLRDRSNSDLSKVRDSAQFQKTLLMWEQKTGKTTPKSPPAPQKTQELKETSKTPPKKEARKLPDLATIYTTLNQLEDHQLLALDHGSLKTNAYDQGVNSVEAFKEYERTGRNHHPSEVRKGEKILKGYAYCIRAVKRALKSKQTVLVINGEKIHVLALLDKLGQTKGAKYIFYRNPSLLKEFSEIYLKLIPLHSNKTFSGIAKRTQTTKSFGTEKTLKAINMDYEIAKAEHRLHQLIKYQPVQPSLPAFPDITQRENVESFLNHLTHLNIPLELAFRAFDRQSKKVEKHFSLENLEAAQKALELFEERLKEIKDIKIQNNYRHQLAKRLNRLTDPRIWVTAPISSDKWEIKPAHVKALIMHLEKHSLNEIGFANKLAAFNKKWFHGKTFFEALLKKKLITEEEKQFLVKGWKAMQQMAEGMSQHAQRTSGQLNTLKQIVMGQAHEVAPETLSRTLKELLTTSMEAFNPHHASTGPSDPLQDDHFAQYVEQLQDHIVNYSKLNEILVRAKKKEEAVSKGKETLFLKFERKCSIASTGGLTHLTPTDCAIAPIQRSPQLALWLQEIPKMSSSTPEQLKIFTIFLQLKTKQSNFRII